MKILLSILLLLLPAATFAGEFVWPTTGTSTPDDIRHTFGPRLLNGVYDFHRGVDFPGDIGDPIYATQDGTVFRKYAEGDPDSPYSGNTLILRHEFETPVTFHGESITRYYSVYLHLDGFVEGVDVDDTVTKGQQIAMLGESSANYPHLHFDIRLGTTCSLYNDCNSTGYDPHVHPLWLLPYTQNNGVQVNAQDSGDDVVLTITQPQNQMDVNRIVVDDTILDFQNRTNIDASTQEALDTNLYNGVLIDVESLDDDNNQVTAVRFIDALSESNTKVDWKVKDVRGNVVASGSLGQLTADSPKQEDSTNTDAVTTEEEQIGFNTGLSARVGKNHKRLVLVNGDETVDTIRLKRKRKYKKHTVVVTDFYRDGTDDVVVVSKRKKRIRIDLFHIEDSQLRFAGKTLYKKTRGKLATVQVRKKSIRFQNRKGKWRRVKVTKRYQLRRKR